MDFRATRCVTQWEASRAEFVPECIGSFPVAPFARFLPALDKSADLRWQRFAGRRHRCFVLIQFKHPLDKVAWHTAGSIDPIGPAKRIKLEGLANVITHRRSFSLE